MCVIVSCAWGMPTNILGGAAHTDAAHAAELVEQQGLVAQKVFVEEAGGCFDVVQEHADGVFLGVCVSCLGVGLGA